MCKITIDARTSGVREGDIIEVGIVAALLFVLLLIALGT
jgi:hypothetical protein